MLEIFREAPAGRTDGMMVTYVSNTLPLL